MEVAHQQSDSRFAGRPRCRVRAPCAHCCWPAGFIRRWPPQQSQANVVQSSIFRSAGGEDSAAATACADAGCEWLSDLAPPTLPRRARDVPTRRLERQTKQRDHCRYSEPRSMNRAVSASVCR